jgi:hypothetical protein
VIIVATQSDPLILSNFLGVVHPESGTHHSGNCVKLHYVVGILSIYAETAEIAIIATCPSKLFQSQFFCLFL